MQNNYLQSFGSYQQHQQNTPYFQNHPGASNSISNLIQLVTIQGINMMGFPWVTQTIINSHQLKWQPIKVQNYQKSKMWWSYCYKEKFLVIKIQLVIHPLPHVIFTIKKDIWQKTVLRQKHVLNVTLKDK